MGLVLGPHARTDRTRDTRVAEPRLPAAEDGRLGEGERLTPDAPHNGGRRAPPGTAPGHPRGTQPQQGMQAKGTVPGPHTRTPAPTTCWRRTPTARPEDGWPGKGQRLTPEAPHNGGRPPPPGTAPHHPRGTHPSQGMQAKATMLGPHACTPAPTAHGWRTPTARPVGAQSGEGERLTSDAPRNGQRRPPRATPFRHPHDERGRTLWDQCWVPTPAPTAPGTHASRNPGCPPQRMGGRGRDSA